MNYTFCIIHFALYIEKTAEICRSFLCDDISQKIPCFVDFFVVWDDLTVFFENPCFFLLHSAKCWCIII